MFDIPVNEMAGEDIVGEDIVVDGTIGGISPKDKLTQIRSAQPNGRDDIEVDELVVPI